MSQKRKTVMIPSEDMFIGKKYISDRLYAWIILNGLEEENNRFSFLKKPMGAYNELGINYRTLYKRIKDLYDMHYIEDSEYSTIRYVTVNDDTIKHKRYIYKDILQRLYDTGLDNIIKVYIYLGSLYDNNKKKRSANFF